MRLSTASLAVALLLFSPGAHAAILPVGDMVRVSDGAGSVNLSLATAMRSDGGFLVAWTRIHTYSNGFVQWEAVARAYDREGSLLGPEHLLAGYVYSEIHAIALQDGRYVVGWSADYGGKYMAQVLDQTGAPDGTAFELVDDLPSAYRYQLSFRLTPTPDGFAALWKRYSPVGDAGDPVGYVWEMRFRKFVLGGRFHGSVEAVPATDTDKQPGLSGDLAALPGGGFCLIWTNETAAGTSVHARRLDAEGAPSTPDLLLASNYQGHPVDSPWIATHADGSCTAIWPSTSGLATRRLNADGSLTPFVIQSGVRSYSGMSMATDHQGHVFTVQESGPVTVPDRILQELDDLGRPESDAIAVSSTRYTRDPALSANASAALVVAWFDDGYQYPDPRDLFVRRFRASGCFPDDRHLCLGTDGRFALEADWQTPDGNHGQATPVPIAGDSGGFWFFAPTSVELLVKLLDGRPVNGHFWVFWGGMTNVGVTLRVTDTLTGASQTYVNPAGTFPSRADVDAFADQPGTAPSASTPAAFAPAASRLAGCGGTSTTMCLHARFEVAVHWKDSQGNEGEGRPQPATTDSGYLWFFRPDSIEMAIKVLDGTALNGHFWVFAAALTNVQYTMTITDTVTGAVRTYENPAGQMRSFGDTEAF